jgi:branched-chain amino acid transport system permease protein
MVVSKIGRQNVWLLGAILLLGLIPLALQNNVYILNILAACLMWGVVAASWDLSIGYANVWSFGHMAFFAIGGYTSAMMDLYLGVPPAAAIPIGGVVAAVIGFLIALPCLRLHGIYIAMVTFGVHQVLGTFIQWGRDYTLGYNGLVGFAPLQAGQYIFSSSAPLFSYYVIFGVSILFFFIMYRVINSPIGLAFVGLRDSEPFAKSLGVNEYKFKLLVFAISSFIAGLMGAFYTSYYGTISPSILDVSTFLRVLIMLMIGGLGRFPGAIIGAFVITGLSEALRPLMLLRFVILGAIVVAVMIVMPQGLMGLPERIRSFVRRRATGKQIEEERLRSPGV